MTPEPSSSTEVVVWREGSRRCELWIVAGAAHLRIYDGDSLKYEERAPPGKVFGRARTYGRWCRSRGRGPGQRDQGDRLRAAVKKT